MLDAMVIVIDAKMRYWTELCVKTEIIKEPLQNCP